MLRYGLAVNQGLDMTEGMIREVTLMNGYCTLLIGFIFHWLKPFNIWGKFEVKQL